MIIETALDFSTLDMKEIGEKQVEPHRMEAPPEDLRRALSLVIHLIDHSARHNQAVTQ